MATKYVSPTGSDSNNGDTAGTPYLTIDKAFDNLTGTGDDVVELADGDYNQTTNLVTGGGTKTAGSITLKSSSSDASLCSISGNTTAGSGNYYLLRNDESGVALVVQNITFKDHNRNDGGAVIFWADQDLTLTNCVLSNLTVTATSGTPSGIIRNYHATNPANLTISGLTVSSCTVSFSGGTGYEGALWSTNKFGGTGTFSDITVNGFTLTGDSSYQLNGMCFHRGTNIFSGTNTFQNITITGGHGSYGLIKLESSSGAYKHSISGTLVIDNVDQTLTSSNGDNWGYINVSSTDTLTINADVEIKNCTSVVGSSQTDNGFMANLHASSSLVVKSPSNGSNIKIHDNVLSQDSGAFGAITNQGGGYFSASSVIAYNNTLNKGVVSIASQGGNSDVFGCLMYDNTGLNGTGIYAYPASGTNVVNIDNCTIVDNTATTGDGMLLNELATTTATYTVRNCIVRNGGTDEISCAGTGDPAVTIINCNIEGGAGAVTGEDTYTNNVDVDPLFMDEDNNNFRLSAASTMEAAGVVNGRKKDYRGRTFRKSAPDIGASSAEFADARTARA